MSTSVLDEPAPQVDEVEAGRLAQDLWDLTGPVVALRSERDRNFRIGDDHVLKVSNSAEPDAIVALENAAMEHLAQHSPDLLVPRLVPTTGGDLVAEHQAPDGRRHLVRVVTVLPGEPADGATLATGFVRELGRTTALMSQALRGFTHPAQARVIGWDPRRVGEVRDAALAQGDPQLPALIDELADLPRRTATLPAHAHHADVTLSNVLTQDGATISGVIDFGDLHHTVRVADAAIALAAVLRFSDDLDRDIADFLHGYQQVQPLEPEEADVLGDLVLARLVLVVVISAGRPASDPHQDATEAENERRARATLTALLDGGRDRLQTRILRACGLSRVRRWAPDETLLERRTDALGGTLSPLFYDAPLHLTHGQGAWVWGADGTRYLDGYNNVPVVGHAHPAVAQAIGRQWRELAVHSRYLHPHLVELAERIRATMPTELDTVVLVNSGSEANDLAWRLATHVTGRRGAIVSDWAYHGVSDVTAALSSNTWHESVRPGHVALFEAPYGSGDQDRPGHDDAVTRVDAARNWLRGRELDVALTAVDLSFTSPGMLMPTDGFVRGLVDATRAAGGLFLADEVQAGYGRSGRTLWTFADHEVVPDFVTLGKPMGNGYPVAALVTRREIVDEFTRIDEFFSTFGGNPVSCVAALTVLDLIEDLDLVGNSRRQGERLRAGLREVGERLGVEMDVRGQGLLTGAALPSIPDGVPRLVRGLLDRGVLTSTTGPGGSVLKVRPPLIWTEEHVATFLAAVESSVRELGG